MSQFSIPCFILLFVGLSIFLVAACIPLEEPGAVVELSQPPGSQQPTPIIIFVTPTPAPTSIPTVEWLTPSPQPSFTPEPTTTADSSQAQVACAAQLEALYSQASDACLGEAEGYFCNGGLPPRAEPVGPISNQMAVVGSLMEVSLVDRVNPPPIPSNHSGGLVWIRLPAPLSISGLLVGDVSIVDVTPSDGNFAPWQSVLVETATQANADCAAPRSAFIVQGPYGDTGRLVVNGVSLEIAGTVAIETEGNTTEFIALEGRTRLVIFGQGSIIQAGEQINVRYAEGDFSRPLETPQSAEPLNFDHIRNFPIVLLDRPVLLPQPGVVYTEGRVNMRAEPDTSSRLLYQVPDDQPLSILGQNPEETWYHVRLGNGETGWMRSDLVSGTVGPIEVSYNPTPVPPQRYGTNANNAVVVAPVGGVLRDAPDVQFPVMKTLPPGTEVELLARSPYSPWVKVNTGAEVGWMALFTLETAAVVSFLPIEYDVPNPPGPTATPFFLFGGGHAYPDPSGGQ